MATYRNYKKRSPKKSSEDLGSRVVENFDLIAGTVGVLFVLALLGLPLIKTTETIETHNG